MITKEKELRKSITIKEQKNQKEVPSHNRFLVKEIIPNPISHCNTYASRGTGTGCRC